MNNIRLAALLAVLVVIAVGPRALAQTDPSLPSGDAVLERYLEATGGRAAYEKIESRITHATMEMPGPGLKGTVTIYQKAPDAGASVTDIAGVGKILHGSDGTRAWETTAMTGPRLVQGQELELMKRQMSLRAELNPKEHFSRIETVGIEEVDGKPTYKVEMTGKDGATETRWFDRESGLLVKSQMTVETQMGKIDATATASDYREVDGIKIPFKSTQTAAGQTFVTAIEEVEHNVPISAEKLAPPADVKKLMQKQAATQPG